VNPYVVFLLYLAAILGFVAITLLMNACSDPSPRFGGEARAFRVRRHAGEHSEREGGADQVLRGGDHLHPLRPRDRLPLHPGARCAAVHRLHAAHLPLFIFLLVLLLLYVYKARLLEAVTQ
jgi:hypothetical protein